MAAHTNCTFKLPHPLIKCLVLAVQKDTALQKPNHSSSYVKFSKNHACNFITVLSVVVLLLKVLFWEGGRFKVVIHCNCGKCLNCGKLWEMFLFVYRKSCIVKVNYLP